MRPYGSRGDERDEWRLVARLKSPTAKLYAEALREIEKTRPPGKGVSTSQALEVLLRSFLRQQGTLAS
jgi:hypothetical protein